MKSVRKILYDQCMEELDGVVEYSKCATAYSQSDPELAKMYLNMAKTEMEHATKLHAMSGKRTQVDAGETLADLWEDLDDAKVEKMALAKATLDNVQLQ